RRRVRRGRDRRLLRRERHRCSFPQGRVALDGDEPRAGRRVGRHTRPRRGVGRAAVPSARAEGSRAAGGVADASGGCLRANGGDHSPGTPRARAPASRARARRSVVRALFDASARPHGAAAGALRDRERTRGTSRARAEPMLRRLDPSLGDVPAERSWLGPIDRSKNGLPFFGPLAGNNAILVGAGYSGNGVGPSFLGGRILASLALGIDDEWATSALVRRPGGFPPEPIRYLGGKVVRSAVARKERAEDAGRRPRRLDLLLASLAPAALVPLRRLRATRSAEA